MANHYYTLIQHTGYTVGGNPQFFGAVEEAWVRGDPLRKAIETAGGIIFDTYTVADRAAYAVNYPGRSAALIPHAKGGFHALNHGKERYQLYIPTDEDRQAFDIIIKETSYASVL